MSVQVQIELFPEDAVSAILEAASAVPGVRDEPTLHALYTRFVELAWRIRDLVPAAGGVLDEAAAETLTTLLTGEIGAYIGVIGVLVTLAAEAEQVSPPEILARAERRIEAARRRGEEIG